MEINWKYLQSMQRDLDMAVMEPRGLTYGATRDRRILAAMVEIGEVANEIRTFKYWSSKPRSSDDVILEELVDVLHFLLSVANADNINIWESDLRPYKTGDFNTQVLGLYQSVLKWNRMTWTSVFQYYLGLVDMLGFSAREVEYAYLRKNEINYERQEEGY